MRFLMNLIIYNKIDENNFEESVYHPFWCSGIFCNGTQKMIVLSLYVLKL